MTNSSLVRRIVFLDLLRTGPVAEEHFHFQGIRFEFTCHSIGWDFPTAERIIRSCDGFADGIAISGIQKRLSSGRRSIPHPGYLKLLRMAQKSPIYVADELRELFAEWTIQRIQQTQPATLSGRRLVFQCASVTPAVEKFEKAGAQVLCADPLVVAGIPQLIDGRKRLERFITWASWLERARSVETLGKSRKLLDSRRLSLLAKWTTQADGLVTFGSLLEGVLSAEMLSALEGKLLIVDYLHEGMREKLRQAGVAEVLELAPRIPGLDSLPLRQFSVMTAVLDQCRLLREPETDYRDYVLRVIQELEVQPNTSKKSGHRRAPVRCAFIIHPLSESDFLRGPGAELLRSAPDSIRRAAIDFAPRLPAFHHGTLRGAVSRATGQEVICDLYALPATPRQILAMREDVLYDKLIACAKQARRRGALIIGLGAYTKVAGDAGVTVARESPIPVTNGNSYSASATLWAAREMVLKMGRPARGKVMVIGATGSIGRVSSLLLAHVADELVLVAQRADKLLELRDEILKINPSVTVRIATQPNSELPQIDLVVTTTSNAGGGAILDIDRVKPGAVICDCSRPLDITEAQARRRPDVMVIQSGEIDLPGDVQLSCDIGLPKPSVYACLAETVLLAMDGRFENFSLSKQLSMEKVKEIYRIGVRHGARLSEIQGHRGVITPADIERCRQLAAIRLDRDFGISPIPEKSPRIWPTFQPPAAIETIDPTHTRA